MKKHPFILTSVCVLVTLAAGCAVLPGSSGKELQGTAWRLVSYGANTPLPGTEMTLKFSGKEIQGSAGCNHYFGSARIVGNQITVNDLAWTEMACLDPEGIMHQEQEIMSLLSQAESYTLHGSRLEIQTGSGSFLIFNRMMTGETE